MSEQRKGASKAQICTSIQTPANIGIWTKEARTPLPRKSDSTQGL